ncbi:MAG: hypothetical protein IKL00_02470, partial [Oscillospiraceae bacterium]|nr:hypothetical protein [Oscillospiraceae bacterium]
MLLDFQNRIQKAEPVCSTGTESPSLREGRGWAMSITHSKKQLSDAFSAAFACFLQLYYYTPIDKIRQLTKQQILETKMRKFWAISVFGEVRCNFLRFLRMLTNRATDAII